MKTTALKSRGRGLGWPRLLRSKSTGAVVLASYGTGSLEHFEGTIIHNDHNNGGLPVGTHSTSFVMGGFEPFHGVINIDTESSE